MTAVAFVDQSPIGEELRRFTLHLASERMSVRALIEAACAMRCAATTRSAGTSFRG